MILEFQNVSFNYPSSTPNDKSRWGLSDVSFAVAKGEALGIAGHTGSGKSTLAQIASGLLSPSEGKVLFMGRSVSHKMDVLWARRQIGLVMQYPERQLFGSTVEEDVHFGLRNLGLPKSEANERIDESLSWVGLDSKELRKMNPFHLSGGQQRRVAIAGILAMQPKLLILDEPTAGLDPRASQEFMSLIESLRDHGTTVIMISHNMNDLARLCQKVLILNNGRVFAYGNPAECFSDSESLKEIGLESPSAFRFAAEMQRAGLSLPVGDSLFDCDSLAKAIAQMLGK